MFRLIIVWCLIYLSVGNIIRGRILLDGDVNRHDSIPTNSKLLIRLEQISKADISEVLSEEINISMLDAFPIEYQIEIPSDTPSASSYRLLVQVKQGPILLYVGEETILAATDLNHHILVDIPVRTVRIRRGLKSSLVDSKPLSWPELVGREGTYAVQYIKEKTGFTNVFVVPDKSPITMDYRIDRVRIFVNEDGIVIRTPCTG